MDHIEWEVKRRRQPGDRVCLCIYYDFTQREQQTPSSLLANLLKQILQVRDRPSTEVERACINACGKNLEIRDYLELLEVEMKNFVEIFIVIDALDEYLDHKNTEVQGELVDYLSNLHQNVKFFFTSRNTSKASEVITADMEIHMIADTEEIEKYVSSRLKDSPPLKELVESKPLGHPWSRTSFCRTIAKQAQQT